MKLVKGRLLQFRNRKIIRKHWIEEVPSFVGGINDFDVRCRFYFDYQWRVVMRLGIIVREMRS